MTRGRITLAVSIVVLLCVALGVYGWMSIHGIDTRQFWYFFATGVGPVIALLWNNKVTAETAQKVEEIQVNTNGRMDQRIRNIVRAELQSQMKNSVLETPDGSK